jgi:hypothetical protein
LKNIISIAALAFVLAAGTVTVLTAQPQPALAGSCTGVGC